MIVEAKYTLKKKMSKLTITHRKTASLTSPAGTGDTDESCNALDLDPRQYLLLLFSH